MKKAVKVTVYDVAEFNANDSSAQQVYAIVGEMMRQISYDSPVTPFSHVEVTFVVEAIL